MTCLEVHVWMEDLSVVLHCRRHKGILVRYPYLQSENSTLVRSTIRPLQVRWLLSSCFKGTPGAELGSKAGHPGMLAPFMTNV